MPKTNEFRILLLTDEFSATYYLAFHYPLNFLSKKYEIKLQEFSRNRIINKTANIKPNLFIKQLLQQEQPNIVVFNRYGLPHGSLILEQGQEYSIKTVYFIDDDLLNIPQEMGTVFKQTHAQKETIAERRYLLENVDLIWASTSYLQNRLSQLLNRPIFFTDSYPPYLVNLISRPSKLKLKIKQIQDKRSFTFGYMGSKGHQRDLEKIVPAIKKILLHFPDAYFETFGTIAMPDELKSFGKRVTSHPVISNYRNFLNHLYRLNWQLGLAPLETTEFNLCKSPIKYLEYTACNIPTLASDISIYNQFNDHQDIFIAAADQWYDKIQDAICHPEIRTDILRKAKKRCSERFSLDSLAARLAAILELV